MRDDAADLSLAESWKKGRLHGGALSQALTNIAPERNAPVLVAGN
jgi:hypothetical protein